MEPRHSVTFPHFLRLKWLFLHSQIFISTRNKERSIDLLREYPEKYTLEISIFLVIWLNFVCDKGVDSARPGLGK